MEYTMLGSTGLRISRMGFGGITLAASSGIDVKTLQSIAGHSDIKMTMERYAHKRDEKIVEAGARIRDVFSSL